MTSGSRVVGPGLLLVLATALVSGVATFVNVYAVHGTSSDAFVTVRNLVVAALLLPLAALVALSRSSSGPTVRRGDLPRLALIGLVGGAVPFLLFFHGLELAAAQQGTTTASFLYRTLFLLAAVLGAVFLRERLRPRYFAGALLLLAGSYLLLSLTPAVWTDGSLFVLGATALWAGEYTISKATLARLPATTVAAGRMGFGGIFLAAYLGMTAQWGVVGRFSSAQWEWVVLSAALLTAFVATWYAGLARVELSVASSVLVVGYPVSWLLSVGLRGAPFTVEDAVGAAAILVGASAIVGLHRVRTSWSWLAGLRKGRRAAS